MNASSWIAACALTTGLCAPGLHAQGNDPLAPVTETQLREVETRLAELRDTLVQHSLGLRVAPSWFRPAPMTSGMEATQSRLEELRTQIRSRRTLLRSVEPAAEAGETGPVEPSRIEEAGEPTTAELVRQALEAARAGAEGSIVEQGTRPEAEGTSTSSDTAEVEAPPVEELMTEPLFDGTRVTSQDFAIPRDSIHTFVVAALRLDRESHRADDPKRRELLRARRDRLGDLVVLGLEALGDDLRVSETYALARAYEITDRTEEAEGLYRQLQVVPMLDELDLDPEPERTMFRELARSGMNRIARKRRRAQRGDRSFSWPRIQGVVR